MKGSLPDCFKVLSDETRLKTLFLLLKESELCVCELVVALGDSQPKISRHLAMLKKHNFVTVRKEKQWVFYSIHPQLPIWLKSVIEQSYSANGDYLAEQLAALQAMGERPMRQSKCC